MNNLEQYSTGREDTGTAWPEGRVKAVLRDFGISVPEGVILTPELSAAGAVAACDGLEPPYVLKVHDERILHKSDVGGVKLDIGDRAALQAALEDFRRRFSDSELLVEEQAPTGVEFILGLLRDADFGLTMMAGFGGVLTEIYQDVAFRVLPVGRADCEDMLNELRAAPLLEGYRGQKADREALVALMLKLNGLVETWDTGLQGLDLNPVLVHEDGVTVVDAKLIVEGEE